MVRRIFKRFIETGSCLGIAKELNAKGIPTKSWTTKNGSFHQGGPWNTQHVYRALNNRTYLGETVHNGESYPGEHEAIVSKNALGQGPADIRGRHRAKEKARRPTRSRPSCEASSGADTATRSMVGTYTKKKNRVSLQILHLQRRDEERLCFLLRSSLFLPGR